VNLGDPDDDRPWERHGALRRDCEPHRAGQVLRLGNVGLAFGSVCLAGCLLVCCSPFPTLVIVLPCSLVGLPCGLTAWVMARRDLRLMTAGMMDPAGLRRTEKARSVSQKGVWFCTIAWLIVIGALVIHLSAHLASARQGWGINAKLPPSADCNSFAGRQLASCLTRRWADEDTRCSGRPPCTPCASALAAGATRSGPASSTPSG